MLHLASARALLASSWTRATVGARGLRTHQPAAAELWEFLLCAQFPQLSRIIDEITEDVIMRTPERVSESEPRLTHLFCLVHSPH